MTKTKMKTNAEWRGAIFKDDDDDDSVATIPFTRKDVSTKMEAPVARKICLLP